MIHQNKEKRYGFVSPVSRVASVNGEVTDYG